MGSDLFAKRLRAYRKLKHMTQGELSQAIGVSVAIIGGLERGTRSPSPVNLQRIASVLQVSMSDLGLEEKGGERS